MSVKALFQPVTLGGKLTLANRMWMAPLTRCRATADTHVPTPVMTEYYSQRASAGLIITECTAVSKGTSAFYKEPGVYSAEQIEAWKKVTSAVHAKGGRIFLQIWHAGRAAHPLNNGGEQPVSASNVQVKLGQIGEQHNPTGKKVDYVVPRPLRDDEIPGIIAAFRTAARSAITAGFDGVEVHGANGYLLDQFLDETSNLRTEGAYSGKSLETRAKLMLDVCGAVIKEVGGERVGLRLSPLNNYNDMKKADPVGVTKYIAEKTSELGLGYFHLMRANFFGPSDIDLVTPARANFKGVLVSNMGYTAEEAEQAILAKKVDAVAFGVPFLANPDLPARFAKGAALNPPNPATFYADGATGYTDYPFLQ